MASIRHLGIKACQIVIFLQEGVFCPKLSLKSLTCLPEAKSILSHDLSMIYLIGIHSHIVSSRENTLIQASATIDP